MGINVLAICMMLLLATVTAEASRWGHILTYKALYRYPPKSAINQETDWWATHYDMVAASGDKLLALKNISPDINCLAYILDSAIPQADSPAVERFAKEKGYDIEELYLHFSEDTVLKTPKGDITIKGHSKKNRENRIETYIWTSKRFVMNLNSPVYREYYQEALKKFPLTAPPTARQDGFFVDEHGPGFPGMRITQGGGILEYGGKNPQAATQAYNDDVAAFLSWQTERLPKETLMIVNTAEYVNDLTLARGLAASGTLMESIVNLKRPHPQIIKEWQFVDTLVSRGKTVVINTAYNYNIPKEFVPGNFGTNLERARLYALAYYYLVKDSDNRLVYFQIGGGWDKPFAAQWFAAQEVNVGKPIATRTKLSSGKDPNVTPYTIHMREFTKALVLFRAKEHWNYNEYGDTTRVTVKLPKGNYHLLREDGTTTAVTGTAIDLRNAEAVILLKG